MPYEPFAPDQTNHSRRYYIIWLGAGAAVFLLFWYFVFPDKEPAGFMVGFAVGGLIGSALSYRADDYFRSLCAMGQSFVCAFVGIYLFFAWIFHNWADSPAPQSDLHRVFFDGYFVALCTALSYYAGYAFAWLRDQPWKSDEA